MEKGTARPEAEIARHEAGMATEIAPVRGLATVRGPAAPRGRGPTGSPRQAHEQAGPLPGCGLVALDGAARGNGAAQGSPTGSADRARGMGGLGQKRRLRGAVALVETALVWDRGRTLTI